MSKFADQYEVLEKLGAGHYAEVFKCRNKSNDRLCAVKVIDKKKTTTKQQGELLGEVAILKELDHKNALKLEGFFDERQTVYVVLSLVTGGELFQRICKEKHFSEKIAATMVHQILSGVEYLHSKGIIHRDLKPENLLLTSDQPDAEIVLVDFGFAEKCGTADKLTKCCGTPLYIAPEVLNAGLFKTGPPYGLSADMWSVGVICYILLCGYPPFRAKTQSDQFKKVVQGNLEFPSSKVWGTISEEAKDFIKNLIILDPSQRMTAKKAKQHKWMSTNVDIQLEGTVQGLREFKPSETWKKGIFGVEAVNRILYLQRCTKLKVKPNTGIERLLTEATEEVTEINLTHNYVGPNGLIALLDVVEKNARIKSLVLGNNGANNAVVEKLCVIAKTHPTLTALDLNHNPISHLAGRMLLHALQVNNRLVKLSLEGTVLQPQMIARIALQLHRNQMAQQRLAAEKAQREAKEAAEEAAAEAANDNKKTAEE